MNQTWKDKLEGIISAELAREIEAYESELAMRKEARLGERVFAERRLRRGVYGQRYDDGFRQDGVSRRAIGYAAKEHKGPGASWDAPGMVRVKIPWGGLSPDQLDALAELAEEYADCVLHATTRQDVQFHFVHLEDTPDLMRRLAAVGLTTREACGNSVRNVTACPYAGVCATEAFDVTPYAEAVARYLLGHRDVQYFGRKFKITFSGCEAEACGLARMHDLGFIARVREDGSRGFQVLVGGGLGAVPHQAKTLEAFIAEEELLATCLAVCRVFAREGEKKNRQRARLKFLVEKIGIDELRRLIAAERASMPDDPRRLALLTAIHAQREQIRERGESLVAIARSSDAFERWKQTNVRAQKHRGFVIATVTLPLGDLSAWQARGLAEVARRFAQGPLRLTAEQNVVLRWVREAELRALYDALAASGLARPGAGTIVDVTACPGTDTCRLGISSSRGLAAELMRRFDERELDPRARELRIKISGCFNACAQHQLADIGFYGMSRKRDDRLVPCFQLVLGGERKGNAQSFGVAIGPVPTKNVPAAIERLADAFVRSRSEEESFRAFSERIGKSALKSLVEDLLVAPSYSEDPSFYRDWGDPRPYSLDDHRGGEGAGHALSPLELGLEAADRELFEAQLWLEAGRPAQAAASARAAMLSAAKTLLESEVRDLEDEPEVIVAELRKRFVETGKLFDDRYRPALAEPFFRAHEARMNDHVVTFEGARTRIIEAQLFVEAAHACAARIEENAK